MFLKEFWNMKYTQKVAASWLLITIFNYILLSLSSLFVVDFYTA